MDNSLKTKEKPPEEREREGGLTPPAKGKTKTFLISKELKTKDLWKTAADLASGRNRCNGRKNGEMSGFGCWIQPRPATILTFLPVFDSTTASILEKFDLSSWKTVSSSPRITAMGYPLHSGDPNILWLGSRGLGVPVVDDRSIRRWVHGHCLLHKAVEEFSPAA